MDIKVELQDHFDKIEGEEIAAYYAYIVDDQNQRWRYAYHRQPRQSIEQFVQEVSDAYRYHREDDFRYDGEII